MNLILLYFYKQAILQMPLEDITEMQKIVRKVFGKDQNVIQVNKHKTIQQISKDIAYQVLEDDWALVSPNSTTRIS